MTSGSVQMTLRTDLQQVAKDALGEQRGIGRRDRADHRRDQGDVELPDVRPQPRRQPRLRPGPRRPQPAPGRPRRSAAGQRLPAALHAGLDVQGADHGHRAGVGRHRPVDDVPRASGRGCRRRPTTRSRTSSGSLCGGDLTEVFTRSCNIPFAQTALEIGGRTDDPGRRRLGRRRADPDRPPAAGGQHVRRPPTTWTRTCRCWRSAASARTTTRWCRCTWRWSPPPSPTAAR